MNGYFINGKECDLGHNRYFCIVCCTIVSKRQIGRWASHFDHLAVCTTCEGKISAGQLVDALNYVQSRIYENSWQFPPQCVQPN